MIFNTIYHIYLKIDSIFLLVSACIENLIQSSDEIESSSVSSDLHIDPPSHGIDIPNAMSGLRNLRIAYKNSDSEDISDDVDVVIESEELNEDNGMYLNDEQNIKKNAKNELFSSQTTSNLGAIPKQSSILQHTMQPQVLHLNSSKTEGALHTKNYASLLSGGDYTFTDQPNARPPQKKDFQNIHKSSNYDDIVKLINSGVKVMVLMRGAPGCGKSFTARQLVNDTVNESYNNFIFSTDDYFYNINDEYIYNVNKLDEAHEFNQRRVAKRAHDGWSPIIVDNTNIRAWEMYVYIDIAVKYGYVIHMIEPHTPWAFSSKKLAKCNSHNVPEYRIIRMIDDYEIITVPEILKLRKLESHIRFAPEQRLFPVQMYQRNQWNQSTKESKPTISNKVETMNMSLNREWGDDWTEESKSQPITSPTGTIPKPVRETRKINIAQSLTPTNDNSQNNNADWKTYDQESVDFWARTSNETQSEVPLKPCTSQPQRQQNKTIVYNENANYENDYINEEDLIQKKPKDKLTKHKIGCIYENKQFAQLRDMYPNLKLEYLWDLFEYCEGNVEWTTDILLSDEQKLEEYSRGNQHHKDASFNCKCDFEKTYDITEEMVYPEVMVVDNAENDQAIGLEYVTNSPSLKNKKNKRMTDEMQSVKKRIEQSFNFGEFINSLPT